MFRKFKNETELRKPFQWQGGDFQRISDHLSIDREFLQLPSGRLPNVYQSTNPHPPVHKYRNTNTQIQQYKNPLIQPLDTLTKTAAHLPPMAFNCVCNCINIHKYRYTVVCTRSLISHTIAESEWKVEDSCLDCFPQLARDAGGEFGGGMGGSLDLRVGQEGEFGGTVEPPIEEVSGSQWDPIMAHLHIPEWLI